MRETCWWLPADTKPRAALESEIDTLRTRVAHLEAQLESAQAARASDYARGKQDGERLRGLPSIIAR